MKNKSLFNKISLLISIVILFLILILSVLGSFNRVGYLSEFKLISSKKNIYTYNFRIKYHSKVFRNSDIYGVYINSKNIINANKYIRKITMNEIGSPFGILESNRKINGDIDNIVYTLKLKKSIIILSLVLVMILLLNSIIIDFIKKLSKFNFRNRYAYILIIFLCFLIMPSIIYKIFYDKFDHFNYESRKFSEKPKFDLKSLDNYTKLYETYFNDYIPFRNDLVKLKNLMDLFVFRNFISDKALLGKNKWLFYKSVNTIENYIGIKKYYFSDTELEKIKNNLIHFRDELKKRNIDFMLMICPDKEFIYTNYMPTYIKRITEASPTDEFVKYIKENTDIKIVYPKDELMKYKDKYQLYYPYEHHWNALGGYIAYSELMKLFNINVKDLESLNILSFNYKYRNSSSYYSQTANYVALSSLEYFKDAKIFVISNFISKKTNIMISNVMRWGQNYYYTNEYSTNTNNIYIIRDSMTQELLDYIFPSFNEISVIPYNTFNKFDIIDKKPNIVVFETLERSFKDRLLNVLPNYKIEEINKDLKTNSIIKNN